MGNYLCKDQADTIRPVGTVGSITGVKPVKINLIGFFLNADSRALLLYLQISGLDFEYVEINMLKGEHTTNEFKIAHPSMHLPIIQDGPQSVYGSTLIQMMHICNRYQNTPDMDRMNMSANL